jgi:carboxyl-terminal processing protease
MIKKIFLFLAFLIPAASSLWSQKIAEPGKISPLLFHMLEEYHYAPPARNAQLSGRISENLFKAIDPYGLLFTQTTIESFRPYRDSLCSANPNLIAEFLTRISETYRRRITTIDSLSGIKFTQKLNFSDIDSLQVIMQKPADFPANEKELEVRYEKWVEYIVLRNLLYEVADSTGKTPATLPDSLYAPGSKLIKKIQIKEKRRIDQLLNCSGGIENFILNSFLNSITSCYDPHTVYFSAPDKERFYSSISKDNYAFGFQLGNNLRDEVIISKILPGSPLWFSGKLEEGDVLVKIKVPDQEETDLTFASIAEVDNIFALLKDNSVDLTVRKTNGTVVTVDLMKGRFDTKENQTAGFILNSEVPVGYIWFSSFYTSLNQYGNVGCSIDLLKELIKLKESGIKGLIVDLRNNPGGSEGEALEIATYFVGNGPLAIETDKTRVERILRNENGAKWYDGPLVILTNHNSASASELLSAILQDYNRAVIVGSGTYGKASGQYVFPVGRKMAAINPFAKPTELENSGFVKLTTNKIFRITGKTYQKTGVIPDIQLPDIFENYAPRESDQPFALPNDSIKTSANYTPFPKLPIDSLTFYHSKRQQPNDYFSQMTALNKTLKPMIKATKETLTLGQYQAESEQLNNLMKEFEKFQETASSRFKVENTPFKMKELEKDTIEAELNKRLLESVHKDIYIDEARSVLIDLIRITNSVK